MHSAKYAIKVEKLFKSFTIRTHKPGFLTSVKGLFNPSSYVLKAIDQLSFEIKPGEKVAFIGPNGAGKSTTIKMLTGILYPSGGHIDVLGCIPWKHRKELGYKIGTVFGQRTQLWYHLPAEDTFNLISKIYEIPSDIYKKRLQDLIATFEIKGLLNKPVSQLSLGERMRCEIVASLLHNPSILFLDEPTIGLDIHAKLMIRELLNKLTHDHGTTIFLTSHDTADIEQICERVLILDRGSLVIDSSIHKLKRHLIKKKVIKIITDSEKIPLEMAGVSIQSSAPFHFVCEVDLTKTSTEKVVQEVLKVANLQDLTIEDPSMEDIIRGLYDSVR
jgi:ABC-2 type transport system ATP-binding protein